MKKCPRCDSELYPPDGGLFSPDYRILWLNSDQVVHLKAGPARLMRILSEAFPNTVSHSDLAEAYWDGKYKPSNPLNNIKVIISTLRSQIEGGPVEIRNERGKGYYLWVDSRKV